MIVQTSSLYSCRIRFLGLREGVMAQCLTLRTPWRWHVAYLITWCPFPSPIHFRCTWDTTVWLVRTPSSAQAESRNTDGQGCEPARAIRWHIARLSLPRSRRRDTASNSPRCQASTTPCQIDSDRRPGRADAPPLTVDGQQSWFQESSAAVIIPLPWWTLSLTTALEDSEGSSLDRSRSLSATRHWLVIVDVVVVVVQADSCPCRCLCDSNRSLSYCCRCLWRAIHSWSSTSWWWWYRPVIVLVVVFDCDGNRSLSYHCRCLWRAIDSWSSTARWYRRQRAAVSDERAAVARRQRNRWSFRATEHSQQRLFQTISMHTRTRKIRLFCSRRWRRFGVGAALPDGFNRRRRRRHFDVDVDGCRQRRRRLRLTVVVRVVCERRVDAEQPGSVDEGNTAEPRWNALWGAAVMNVEYDDRHAYWQRAECHRCHQICHCTVYAHSTISSSVVVNNVWVSASREKIHLLTVCIQCLLVRNH